jgi:chromosome partitioning protein
VTAIEHASEPPCTLAFANHKGGCGKTTSVANTSAALAALGFRVLGIDADPQANLSEAFGVGEGVEGPRLEDSLAEELVLAPWSVPLTGVSAARGGHLGLVPCSAALEAVITGASGRPDFAHALAHGVAALEEPWDFVLIDTPPGLGALSSMAMLAADWVAVPARPADFDVAGALKLSRLVEDELALQNPRLRLLGVLVTQVDRRWTLAEETRARLAAAGVRRLRTEIPFSVRVGAAPRQGVPTVLAEPDSKVSVAYHHLAEDLSRLSEGA